ncbi:hypothetical protein [Jonesia denitrificans]|uniref:HhH-GPD family protein n=1 Tax=Jonesia denitrificans (strain ATCC 14870 / DSM 20603 / BCRC 15368 / CIP 55.134 / JCM 11481 / NBRC 15587 / NCTC 10816 / Prevot 55134) TaxID=471856 RepID=C7R1W9_JONDD|nr:hypothetical protein [Jonesia denitrificans]ACV08437.1 hypothetical protein Jden_0774 [Jonesia denitrificans DSM 20603]ASE07917.1 hypothetical protein CEP80_01295 [Jonesia denitrificans]QXB42526.1 hypothetical protein I6L70_08155 [Jonesia denitrificans]SQH20415.1 Uncharacterised protein [Jonesia denitrificans]
MTSREQREAVLAATKQVPEPFYEAYPGGWPGEVGTALVDAVYSIRARYRTRDPQLGVLGRVRAFRETYPAAKDDLGSLSRVGSDDLKIVMGSGKTAGRLKSVVVLEAADSLVAAGFVRADDVLAADPARVKNVYTAVSGLGWVTYEYFSMLLGVPGVKADTMIVRFVNLALAQSGLSKVNAATARDLVIATWRESGKGATLTHFEHALWRYQSESGA